MTANYHLRLDLKSYWCMGTGKGSGNHVDAVVDTDRFGCPFIAGRMLKGLLRDAVSRALHWNRGELAINLDTETLVEILFGSWAYEALRPRHETKPGLIRLSDARMDTDIQHWLHENPSQRQALFRDIYSTAIDSRNGVARQGSLRGQQVVVPMLLQANLQIYEPVEHPPGTDEYTVYQQAGTIINTALPLIRAVGSGRTRGLGRATLTLENSA